jgi:hypothetical protein
MFLSSVAGSNKTILVIALGEIPLQSKILLILVLVMALFSARSFSFYRMYHMRNPLEDF